LVAELQDKHGFSPIARFAPDSISGDVHGAQSQARDPKIISNQEFTGSSRERLW
jgi:hypothetical protein